MIEVLRFVVSPAHAATARHIARLSFAQPANAHLDSAVVHTDCQGRYSSSVRRATPWHTNPLRHAARIQPTVCPQTPPRTPLRQTIPAPYHVHCERAK